MFTFDIHVVRDGRWWMVTVPELAVAGGQVGNTTQARHPGEIEEMAREYISVTLNLPMDTIALRRL